MQEKGVLYRALKRSALVLLCFLGALILLPVSRAADLDEFKVKREPVFEFAQKPAVTREGDKVMVAFETLGLCDVTVAIENMGGRIIRHMASGVLGPNAPAPFQKNSKKQVLFWDGKDDQDAYVDNKSELVVRVSLGLTPKFERSLFHSPYKRFGRNQPTLTAAPEGVYVYEGDIVDSIRLFDHDGNYVRTVYPFPADKLGLVQGLRWRTTPDGVKVPFKEGSHQATFFGSGYNGGFDPNTGYGAYRLRDLHSYDGLPSDPAASALAVHGNRLALVGFYINRLSTDGSTGGMDIHGAKASFPMLRYGYCQAPVPLEGTPLSAAFSPDGKWVYLSGYTVYGDCGTAGAFRHWLHGVVRVGFDGTNAPEVFAGNMKQGDASAGTGDSQFNSPTSVACDAEGHVYVSDYVNNRIQIFTPDGTCRESIPVNRPARVFVHQKSGEIYVASWAYSHNGDARGERVDPKLTRFEAQAGHKMIAEYKLPLGGATGNNGPWGGWMGIQYRVELDSWTEPPTIWLIPEQAGGGESWAPWGIKLLTVEKDKLTMKKDLGIEAHKAVTCDAASSGRQRLSLNPKTGKVYILSGMGTASGDQVVEVDPVSGKDKRVNLPFGSEDLCFDINGLAYLRTGEMVARYDPATWREVPWDYGEERTDVSHCGGRTAPVLAGLVVPGTRPGPWFHCGGFGVSPKGHLVVQCFNGGSGSNAKLDRPDEQKLPAASGKPYEPGIYPGRQRWGEIHIWDAYGKVLHEDAAPGITITDGVCIDRDDNVYVMTNPGRTPGGKQVLNPLAETLIKFKPGKGRVITSGNEIAVPLQQGQQPNRPPDIYGTYQSPAWVEGAEWMYGGVGYGGTWRCTCWNARFALDFFARSFAPEPDRFSVAVLDSAGNLIVRIGRAGNVDDGKPLISDPVIKQSRSIGGDETALMHACYVAVDTDKRVVIEDSGNRRLACVKLGYTTRETVALKDVPDAAAKK